MQADEESVAGRRERRRGDEGRGTGRSDWVSLMGLNEWRRCVIQKALNADSTMIYASRQRRRGARERDRDQATNRGDRPHERQEG